jgi:hypothetical protein
MRKTAYPSAAGEAAATARVDPGAIAATTTVRKVAAARVCLEPIPSRCPRQRTIVGRRTKGAIKSREISPLASWEELRLLCLIDTSSSCRERSRRHSPGNRLMKWSTCKIGFDEEDHPASTRGMGTIPLLCTPTVNNVTVNHTLIDGGAGLNIISVEIFGKMQVPYHRLMPTRPFFG